jgi:hypothetical protein
MGLLGHDQGLEKVNYRRLLEKFFIICNELIKKQRFKDRGKGADEIMRTAWARGVPES